MPCTRPVLVRGRPARRLHGSAAVLQSPGVPCCNAAALRRNRHTMLQRGATGASRTRARARRGRQANTPHKQTHTSPTSHTRMRTNARTHARTAAGERESTALRCEKTRSGGGSGDAMRCNRRCGGATGSDALQQVVRRCNSRCVVATGGASLLHDELSRCNAGGADASYIGAHLRCAVECDGLQAALSDDGEQRRVERVAQPLHGGVLHPYARAPRVAPARRSTTPLLPGTPSGPCTAEY